MQLDWLHLLNFKNFTEREFTFQRGINCLVGPNGKGKTNVLDAIYYLCFTKSFLNYTDSQNISFNEPFFMLEGRFNRFQSDENIQVSFKRGQKKIIRRNKKEYEKLANHIGLLPAVVVCPQYSSIITGAGDERRRWLDTLISQFDSLYLQHLINYQRLLQQRNSLLKQMAEANRWDEVTLLVYDTQLTKYGHEIYKKRKDFITEFIPVFNELYYFITNGAEDVSLILSSQLDESVNLAELLIQSRSKDRSLQYTTKGIHKDDLDFISNGMNIKKFASQGQQKSFLMALKLAEYQYLTFKLNLHPLLMLDDVFDKLDEDRVKQLLMKIASKSFGQVFITDTGSKKLKEILDELEIEGNFHHI